MPVSLLTQLQNPVLNQQPRFGWASGWRGHRAIEEGATTYLDLNQADKKLVTFLKKNQHFVFRQSSLEDRDHAGKDHFVNLGLTNTGKVVFREEASHNEKNMGAVKTAFTPEQKGVAAKRFQSSPLNLGWLASEQNVFQAAIKNYDALVNLLKHASAVKPEQAKDYLEKLSRQIGSLAHYVGDLHQPLHTTAFYTWTIPAQWKVVFRNGKEVQKNDIHSFIELKVFDQPHYQKLEKRLIAESAQKKRVQALSRKEIQTRLAQEVESGFKAVFDIVAQDLQARQRAGSSQSLYEKELRQALLPIVSKRLEASTRNLATMVYSAFVEAGRPDLLAVRKPNRFDTALRS